MKVTKILGRKIGLGRFGLPVWAMGLSVVVIGAAAGQAAVGPVLSGSVAGQAGVTVEQAIVLGPDSSVIVPSGSDALLVQNDEGTSFTTALSLQVGDTAIIKLDINNNSDSTANAIMQLNVPRGVDDRLWVKLTPSAAESRTATA